MSTCLKQITPLQTYNSLVIISLFKLMLLGRSGSLCMFKYCMWKREGAQKMALCSVVIGSDSKVQVIANQMMKMLRRRISCVCFGKCPSRLP